MDDWVYIAGSLGCFFLGGGLFYLFARKRADQRVLDIEMQSATRQALLDEKLNNARVSYEKLNTIHFELKQKFDEATEKTIKLSTENAALAQENQQIEVLATELDESRDTARKSDRRNLELEKKVTHLAVSLEAVTKQSKEKIALLNEARENLKGEFNLLANRIFEEKNQVFSRQSKTRIETLVTPLKEQMADFRRKVEDLHDRQSRDRAALFNEIAHFKELNLRIGKDALNLTKALKGDVKQQGNWGEVILERVLEASGLEKGRDYEVQVSLVSDQKNRLQPDVIVRLPGQRDVVVDAKVSLTAYERYHGLDDEAERAIALKEHLSSIQSHVRVLSAKRYQDLEQIRSLDFVILFIPVEGAFFAAAQADENFFMKAFEKNIMIVCPSTLLVTLRVIHNMWQFVSRNKNALEIAKQAGLLFDKFAGFTQALEDIGQQLDRAKDSYNIAMDRLATGKGNLVGKALKLKALGAKSQKKLATSIADPDEFELHKN